MKKTCAPAREKLEFHAAAKLRSWSIKGLLAVISWAYLVRQGSMQRLDEAPVDMLQFEVQPSEAGYAGRSLSGVARKKSESHRWP